MKDMRENLPVKIQSLVSGKKYTCDDMGKSQAKVLMFDDCVLKIEKTSEKNDETDGIPQTGAGQDSGDH